MDEKELAERCSKGENQARKRLYEQYSGQLMAVCLRYTGERESAEDVLHDGFLKIFCSIRSFSYQGEGSLSAWLSRVMANEALNFMRRQKKTLKDEVPMEQLPDVSDEESDVDQLPPKVLMKFIRELPDGYRTVFNLFVFEEKTHKEIASILGITEHASSSQFFRARMLLMKRIKEYKETTRPI